MAKKKNRKRKEPGRTSEADKAICPETPTLALKDVRQIANDLDELARRLQKNGALPFVVEQANTLRLVLNDAINQLRFDHDELRDNGIEYPVFRSRKSMALEEHMILDLLHRAIKFVMPICSSHFEYDVEKTVSVLRSVRDQLKDLQSQENSSEYSHSDDFSSITWAGEYFTLTHMQAACIELLWKASESRNPTLSDRYILGEAGSDCSRLRDVFKSNPVMLKKIILPGDKKGTHKLNLPPKSTD